MTQNHIQGILGEFKPVLDRVEEFTTNHIQGIFGEFKPVLIYVAAPPPGTNMKINIGDTWKDIDSIKINIGDVWKDVTGARINVGDSWRTIF